MLILACGAAQTTSVQLPNLFADLPLTEFLPPARTNVPHYSLSTPGSGECAGGPIGPGQLLVPDEACVTRWIHEDGTFILAANNRVCLDVFASKDALGIFACHGGDNQKFTAVDETDLHCAVSDPRHCVLRRFEGLASSG